MARNNLLCKSITLPSGKRKWIYGSTQAELEQKLMSLRCDLHLGIDPDNDPTFMEYSSYYLTAYKQKVSDRYRCQLAGWIEQCSTTFGNQKMRTIQPMQIAYVINTAKPSVAPKLWTLLHDIFSEAVNAGITRTNPVTPAMQPGYRTMKRKGLSPAEVSNLLNDFPSDITLYRFVILALRTGMRRGEILGLHWEDIDLKGREINVQHNLTHDGNAPVIHDYLKTESGKRKIPLDDIALGIIKGCPITGPIVLTGQPMTKSAMDFKLKKLKPYTAHQLRHTAITNWFDAGLDIKEVQYLAGHATSQTTLDVYTDYLVEKRYAETHKKLVQGMKGVI